MKKKKKKKKKKKREEEEEEVREEEEKKREERKKKKSEEEEREEEGRKREEEERRRGRRRRRRRGGGGGGNVEYESMMEQPYYVINRGWCSFNPSKTHNKYGLVCKQLNVGDTCISLCRKNLNANATAPQSPNKPTNSTSQSKTSKRKDLEKHFNLLSSKDRELNERKRRRWSAPDQINEKTNKKVNAKQAKLNNSVNNGETCQQNDGESTSTNQLGNVASLPTSTNNDIQNGGGDVRTINTPVSSYQQSVPNGNGLISQQPNGNGLIPNSYYQYSNPSVSASSSVVNSHQFPPSIPVSHFNYVTNPSSTNPTHLITRPIVSHLPLSSASTLAMTSASPATNFSISTLSTPASSKHPEGLLPYGGGPSGKISYLPRPPSLPGMPPTGPPSNFPPSSSYASSSFINGTPISINGTPISSIVYSRNGTYPISSGNSLKYSAPLCGKNSFSNVDRLAKSANESVSVSGGAVDFSKYSTQK
ncbi:hypothetical protein WDU94_002915 [Cyamophila willieti]